MNKTDFTARMALFSKAKEYGYEWDADGNVVVYPSFSKHNLTATIDPEKGEVLYHMAFAEPVIGAYIPVDELRDLEYFVRILTEGTI